MLLINENKKYRLTLKVVSNNEKINPLVIKENFTFTLISEENKIYLYLEDKTKINYYQLKEKLLNYFKNVKYDLDICVESFPFKVTKMVELLCDVILYSRHQTFNYKSKKNYKNLKFNLIIKSNLDDIKAIVAKMETIYEYKNFARDLQNMPPNKLYPKEFANLIKQKALNFKNIKLTILEQKDIIANKMGLLLAVNAGSNHDARVVIIEYNGNPNSNEKVAIVGKGITFDTGGVSLKPSSYMAGMKYDMSGGAIAINSVLIAAELKLKTNLIAIACLTENHIGSSATLVESVVTSMSGKTVEITNTDAEGRLVVADGITYAIEKCKATKIIELSTLTGAILISLGHYMTGVFASDDHWYQQLKIAAKNANEEIWRMPMHRKNLEYMKDCAIADIKNTSSNRYGGSSNGAVFINYFAQGLPFIHLDIAGSANEETKFNQGSGVMIRTLVELFSK